MNRSKVLIGWFLIILMAFIGFVIETAIGSFFVPEGSGMAGPATALGYGFVGLLIALVAGSFMMKKLPFEILRVALYITAFAALLACGFIIYRIIVVQQNKNDDAPTIGISGTHTDQKTLLVTKPAQLNNIYSPTKL